MVTSRRLRPLPALLVLAALSLGCGSGDVDRRGVRLGLTAADTRARFVPPGPGSWASEAGGTLRWTASQPGEPLREAIFEFHQGMLVATRWLAEPASPDAEGPPLEATPGRLTTREPEAGAVRVTTLSRTCPAHADEVARRLSGASRLRAAIDPGRPR